MNIKQQVADFEKYQKQLNQTIMVQLAARATKQGITSMLFTDGVGHYRRGHHLVRDVDLDTLGLSYVRTMALGLTDVSWDPKYGWLGPSGKVITFDSRNL